jgi:aspartate 1-decarboxylase
MSYAALDEREAKTWRPKVIVLGSENKIVNERGI